MARMSIVFCSRNAGKIKEMAELLKPLNVDVLSAADVDIPEVEETGRSFEENALIKAKAGAQVSGLPTLADDSGLCVHALNNEPNIYTARFAQKCGGYPKAFENLLKRLEEKKDKSAHFECCLVLAFPNGKSFSYTGKVNGKIVPPQEGKEGFGFDPIFMPDGFKQTFSQIPESKKNDISHRGKAVAAFIKDFKKIIEM